MANTTQRIGATKTTIPGTNFFVQIILLIGSLFTFFNFTQIEVQAAVAALFGLIGFGGAFREKLKAGLSVDWAAWIKNPNTWSYLAAVLASILPALSPDAVKFLQSLTEGILAGNWQQAITAAFSLLSILFFMFRPKVQTK